MEELNFQLMNLLKEKKDLKLKNILDFYEGPGVQHIAVATDDYRPYEMRKREALSFYLHRRMNIIKLFPSG